MLLLVRCSVLGSDLCYNPGSNKTSEPGADVRQVVVEVHHGEEGVGAGPAVVDVVDETHQAEGGLLGHVVRRVEIHGATDEMTDGDAVAEDLVSE